MLTRRRVLALPLIVACPAAAQARQPLAAALAICWQARGVRFTEDQIARRIGNRWGKAALIAVAGSVISADDTEEEIAVEIVWEAGQPPSPAEPLLHRDLGRGWPALLLTLDERAWLLHGLAAGMAAVQDPISGAGQPLPLARAALIGRPVIAGA